MAATSGLDSIVNIARARRLGLFGHVARFSGDASVSNILTICCAYGDDILPTPPEGAQVENLETLGLITSILSPACLRLIRFLWHKIVRS